MTASLYDVPKLRPDTVAWWFVESLLAAVQTSGASRPYAIVELAGTDVRHVIVAPNGVSDTVWTSSIIGAGGVGADGAVVVGAGGGAALDARPGIARNLRSLT